MSEKAAGELHTRLLLFTVWGPFFSFHFSFPPENVFQDLELCALLLSMCDLSFLPNFTATFKQHEVVFYLKKTKMTVSHIVIIFWVVMNRLPRWESVTRASHKASFKSWPSSLSRVPSHCVENQPSQVKSLLGLSKSQAKPYKNRITCISIYISKR